MCLSASPEKKKKLASEDEWLTAGPTVTNRLINSSIFTAVFNPEVELLNKDRRVSCAERVYLCVHV